LLASFENHLEAQLSQERDAMVSAADSDDARDRITTFLTRRRA